VAGVLAVVPLAWLAVAALAVRRGSAALELLATLSVSALLIWPVRGMLKHWVCQAWGIASPWAGQSLSPGKLRAVMGLLTQAGLALGLRS
jgi:hypothetical protein